MLILAPLPLTAQQWVRGGDLPLAREAAAIRAAQAADSTLAAWRATAHGWLRVGAVPKPGEAVDPLPAKADELTVDVFGLLPDRIRQIVRTWADTLIDPGARPSRYHRDHLGIVTSDFGPRIRLGDGDEVRDLIHPLSEAGLDYYLFAAGDTVRIITPQENIRVVAVAVRPVDPSSSGTIGTLFIDPARRALVRFRFTFTPESYRDPSVRDITVTLESALVDLRYWLPSRQSIVIRRNHREFGMLRADWTIRDYVLGDRGPDTLFRQGADSFPAIGGLATRQGSPERTFAGQPPIDENVYEAIREASAMVDGLPLQRLPRRPHLTLEIARDLVALNRVEGMTLYPGIAIPLGRKLTATVRAGYGFSDHRMIGLLRLDGALGRAGWRIEGEHSMQDVGDLRPLTGWLALAHPLITRRDLNDWALVTRGTFGVRIPIGQLQLAMGSGLENSRSVSARYMMRADRENPPLGAGTAAVARLSLGRKWANENEVSVRSEVGRGEANWQRVASDIKLHHTALGGRFVLRASAGAGSRELPAYRHFVIGGFNTLPGFAHRSIGGRQMYLADLGYERRVDLFGMLGLGRSGARRPITTLGPFIAAGRADGDDPLMPWRAGSRMRIAGGVRLNPFGLPVAAAATVK